MQRMLRFAQHLPKYGWRPIILSIHPSAYEETGEAVGNEVARDLVVHRAFGVNAAARLSILGRYPAMLAIPDRWASWRFWAVPKAVEIIRSEAVDVLWTTFPIATAHQIGLAVARRCGVPWLAEFRDPMWQTDWPPEPKANRAWRELETKIFANADKIVFATPGAQNLYAHRFPAFQSKLRVIENGFDEETFRRAEELAANRRPGGQAARPVVLLHSGIIYSSERDPSQLFLALASLKTQGAVRCEDLQIVLRAPGTEVDYTREFLRLGISDLVRTEPPVDYVDALNEMLTVDGLLILQASNCNAQIPAKLYEYLRARRPILALTDPEGDTAKALQAVGAGVIARLDSVQEIKAALLNFIERVRMGDVPQPPEATIARYSRESQTGQLAALLREAAVATKA